MWNPALPLAFLRTKPKHNMDPKPRIPKVNALQNKFSFFLHKQAHLLFTKCTKGNWFAQNGTAIPWLAHTRIPCFFCSAFRVALW